MPELPGSAGDVSATPPLPNTGAQNASAATALWAAGVNAEILKGVTIDQAKEFISAHLDDYLAWREASATGRFQIVPPGQ